MYDLRFSQGMVSYEFNNENLIEMKIQIENLRAQMRGVQLNGYQRALALDEYYKLLDYVEELEQLTMPAVVDSLISKFQEIIYSDLSDSEIVNALHKLDNNR